MQLHVETRRGDPIMELEFQVDENHQNWVLRDNFPPLAE